MREQDTRFSAARLGRPPGAKEWIKWLSQLEARPAPIRSIS